MKRYGLVLVVLALCSSGCDVIKNLFSSSTTPSGSTSSSFTGSLTVGGTNMFTFTTTQSGTANITLTSLATATPVGLGLGTVSGATCTLTTSNTATTAGAVPQVSATLDAGTYCAEVFDPGTLTSATTFALTITHS
jgi:hypothetical protein